VRETVFIWALVELVGVLALPVAGMLFSRLPGLGLAIARPLGLLLAAYPIWLLASVHVLPYSGWSPYLGIGMLAVCALAIWLAVGRPRPSPVALRLWLAGEAVFTLTFIAWVVLRSFAPEIWNTEQPMDMAIVNAVEGAKWFPPLDPWLSGQPLNYYYLGHYLVAFLVRGARIDPATGYNLGVALFYALTATAVFGLTASLVLARGSGRARAAIGGGLAGAGIAMALGNLAGTFQLLRHPGPLSGYDWWSPSRVIEGTANEFPFFSFLLGDLHAHVMATPFALLAVAVALQLALVGPRIPWWGSGCGAGWGSGWGAAVGELMLASLVVGLLYAVNPLDVPTVLILICGGLLVWLTRDLSGRRLAAGLVWFVVLVCVAAALVAPFAAHFSPTTRGLAIVRDHQPFTRLVADLGSIYSLPLWMLVAALAHRLTVPWRYLVWSAVALMVILVLLAPERLAGLFLVLLIAAVALHAWLDTRLPSADRYFWLLVGVACGLIAAWDFVYIRDLFDGTANYRFNTVFKLGYQAWFLLAIAAGYGVVQSAKWLRRPALWAWRTGLVIMVGLVAVYPVAGSYARTGGFRSSPTLDGERWLERSAPDDAAAIGWLREHTVGSPVLVEGVGPDYSPAGHARVSTFTGLPTVLGWAGHELQWGHDPGHRASDVTTLYQTRDLDLARELLERYGIRYVFVGSLEQRQYPAVGLVKFAQLGRVAFRSGPTLIYDVGA
jgi:YYY domain-containing protein